MKRFSIYLFATVLFCCVRAMAQSGETEVRLLQLNSANECAPSTELSLPGNAAFGFGLKEDHCREAEESIIQLRQVGDGNTAQFDIAAESIDVRVLQSGNRNTVNADIRGDNVKDWAIQRGHDNSLNHLISADGVSIETHQSGHGLELTHIETGGGFPRYIITQTGADMSVVITNGAIR